MREGYNGGGESQEKENRGGKKQEYKNPIEIRRITYCPSQSLPVHSLAQGTSLWPSEGSAHGCRGNVDNSSHPPAAPCWWCATSHAATLQQHILLCSSHRENMTRQPLGTRKAALYKKEIPWVFPEKVPKFHENYFPFNEVAGKSRSGSRTANCYCLERCVIFTKATITSQ